MTQRAALMLLVLAAASARPARAEDDPACARYEDPLAYNACLASHGPKANNLAPTGASAGRGGSARGDPGGTQQRAGAESIGGSRHVMRGHGRVHMEFQVK